MYDVLIADDNPLVGQSLAKAIPWNDMGCRTPMVVLDGDSARLEIEDRKPHIIISDIRMPGMDGLELLEWYRGQHGTGSYIIITGFDDFSYAQRALKSGATDLIIKPIDNDELINSIRASITKIHNREKKRNELVQFRENAKSVEADLRVKFYRDLLEKEQRPSPTYYDFDPSRCNEFLLLMDEKPRQEIMEKIKKLYSIEWDSFAYNHNYLTLFYNRGKTPLRDLPALLKKWDEESDCAISPVFENIADLPFHFGELCSQRMEQETSHPRQTSHNPQIRGALRYICKNYDGKITLEETALSINLSGSHLTRLLKKELGFGFIELLTRYRIARAVVLLKEGRANVSEAGIKVGLPNYAHFYQVFKKTTSFPPKGFPFGDETLFRQHTEILKYFHGDYRKN